MTTISEIIDHLEANGLELTVRISPSRKPTELELSLIERHATDIKRYFLLNQVGGELIETCRVYEQKIAGARYCKHCWRYQLNPCFPGTKMLVQNGDKLEVLERPS
jgi:hypothetical protein